MQIVAILPSTTSFILASGGVAIDFDRTIYVQMGLFILLMLVLGPVLFRPLLRLFEEREKRTEGARQEARAMQEKAASLLARYEEELGRVQKVASTEREKLRNETLRLEAKILEEARVATTTIVDEGRKRLETEMARLRVDLERQSNEITQEIALRVLGREVK